MLALRGRAVRRHTTRTHCTFLTKQTMVMARAAAADFKSFIRELQRFEVSGHLKVRRTSMEKHLGQQPHWDWLVCSQYSQGPPHSPACLLLAWECFGLLWLAAAKFGLVTGSTGGQSGCSTHTLRVHGLSTLYHSIQVANRLG